MAESKRGRQLSAQEQLVAKAAAGEIYFNVANALARMACNLGAADWLTADGLLNVALNRINPSEDLLKLAQSVDVAPDSVKALGKTEVLNNDSIGGGKVPAEYITPEEMTRIVTDRRETVDRLQAIRGLSVTRPYASRRRGSQRMVQS